MYLFLLEARHALVTHFPGRCMVWVSFWSATDQRERERDGGKKFGGWGQYANTPVGEENLGMHRGHCWGKQTGLLHSGSIKKCHRAGLRCAVRLRIGNGVQANWLYTVPRDRWGARAGGVYLGKGSVPRANLPFITKGLPFVGQSPLRNPHQKHKVAEIFLGLASWCSPQNSVGGLWEKTPSFPLVVPGRLFSVSSTWLQVEIPKWIWQKHLQLVHIKTSTLLTQQSPCLRNNQPDRGQMT